MPNILLTRIDNRLVHGQVGVTWVNHLGANLIVVANDEVSQDPVQQNLMEMVIPDAIGIRFFSIQKTIDVIHKAAPRQKIFLVVRNPQDALRFSEGKEQISSTVSIDENDKEAFRNLKELGIALEIRRVPDENIDEDIYKHI